MTSKRVVLITGSSTGFGRLSAETLARKGYTVYASMRDITQRNARNAAEVQALAKKESLSDCATRRRGRMVGWERIAIWRRGAYSGLRPR